MRRQLILTTLLAALSLSASAATYRISSSPSTQVEQVQSTYQLSRSPVQELVLPGEPSGPVELMPTRGRAPNLNDLRLNLGEYPGKENPYVLPEGTRWPYPMSAPTYDGHYHLPGGQW